LADEPSDSSVDLSYASSGGSGVSSSTEVAGAASAGIRFAQDATRQQVVDVAQAVSGEHLAMAAHLLLVSLPSKPSSNLLSSFTWRSFSGVVGCPALPEPRLGQHRVERVLCLIDGAMQRSRNQASHSVTSIDRFWVALQDVVVGLALRWICADKAVEALRAAICACQQQIADGTRDAAIAIVEGVQVTNHRWQARL
jgi:hypothetical protein